VLSLHVHPECRRRLEELAQAQCRISGDGVSSRASRSMRVRGTPIAAATA